MKTWHRKIMKFCLLLVLALNFMLFKGSVVFAQQLGEIVVGEVVTQEDGQEEMVVRTLQEEMLAQNLP